MKYHRGQVIPAGYALAASCQAKKLTDAQQQVNETLDAQIAHLKEAASILSSCGHVQGDREYIRASNTIERLVKNRNGMKYGGR